MPVIRTTSSTNYIEVVRTPRGDFQDRVRICVDIPTSAEDAWLSFELDLSKPSAEARVENMTCIRGGRGGLADMTYVWTEGSGEWELFDDGADSLGLPHGGMPSA